MKILKKKDIKRMLDIWSKTFAESNGLNVYNREVCTNLRNAGFSISQLQDQIAIIKIKNRDKNATLTALEEEVLEQYLNLDIESDLARNDDLCASTQGLKFLQSSQRGYSEKQSIDMNSNINLMDVIAENTKNK